MPIYIYLRRGAVRTPYHPSVMPLIRCISNMNSHK